MSGGKTTGLAGKPLKVEVENDDGSIEQVDDYVYASLSAELSQMSWSEAGMTAEEVRSCVLQGLREKATDPTQSDDTLEKIRDTVREAKRVMLAQERRANSTLFKMPPRYQPFEEFADRCVAESHLALMSALHLIPKNSDAGLHLAFTFRHWCDNHRPLVALTPELALALRHTTPPDDIKFKDVLWPYSFWVVAMPRGVFTTPEGHSVNYLVVRTTTPDSLVNGAEEFTDRQIEDINSGRIINVSDLNVFQVSVVTDGVCYYRTLHPEAEDPISEFMVFPELDKSNLSHADDIMLQQMITMIFNISLYFMACPDDFQESQFVKRIKMKKEPGKKKRPKGPEVWTPNLIGKAYSTEFYKHENSGNHASPRTHWRRGHWHRVRYGEGRKQMRIDWFKSVLVNAGT